MKGTMTMATQGWLDFGVSLRCQGLCCDPAGAVLPHSVRKPRRPVEHRTDRCLRSWMIQKPQDSRGSQLEGGECWVEFCERPTWSTGLQDTQVPLASLRDQLSAWGFLEQPNSFELSSAEPLRV